MTFTVSVAPVIGTDNSSTAFVSVSIVGCTAGNALVGAILWNIAATSVTTVTATGESNGTLVGSKVSAVGANGTEVEQLFYFPNLATGGTKTVQANFTGTNPDAVIVVMEVAGGNVVALPDPNASWHQETSGTSINPAGAVTTNTANTLLISATMGGTGGAPTVPAGWTNIAGVDAAATGVSMTHSGVGYLLNAGASGAHNFTWTLALSDTYPIVTAAFQIVSAGSPATGAKMADINLLLTPLAISSGTAPTVNIAAGSGSNQTVALAVPVSNAQGGMNQVQVYNAGTITVFVAFGPSTVAATLASSYPVPAGFIVTLTPPAGATTAAAIATGASGGAIYFTSANGR